MPLRRRISIVAAGVVAVAVAIAVIISYVAVRNQLRGQIDNELLSEAVQIREDPQGSLRTNESNEFSRISAKAGGPIPYWQVVTANGRPVMQSNHPSLPGGTRAATLAAGKSRSYFANVSYDGTTLREYVFPGTVTLYANGVPEGNEAVAIQIYQTTATVNNVLAKLKWILALVFLAVVGLAAVLARFVTRRVLTPLGEMTATVQAIAETEDLDRRIEVYEDDEIGQLATRFNEMLERLATSREALDASVTAQRQLVADASHELRTPVTSLRTNVEVLLAGAVLDDEDRDRLLTDVVEQSEELTALVSDLIEVARGDMPAQNLEDTRLDRLVEAALDRARRNAPQIQFSARIMPITVTGNPERLTRAINNLLDNASRHTEPGTAVDVTVDGLGVTVRDHGGGIAEQDLPHIFDRFYRGEDSRARQGSGLGLAIVRQVAEQHGGSITAANAPDGGAVFTLALPTAPVAAEPRPATLWSTAPVV